MIYNGSSSVLNYILHRNTNLLRSTEGEERSRKKGDSGKEEETASKLKDVTNNIYRVLFMWGLRQVQPGQCP